VREEFSSIINLAETGEIFEIVFNAVHGRMDKFLTDEIDKLMENSVHPKIAKANAVTKMNKKLIQLGELIEGKEKVGTMEYPSKEELMALASDDQRLKNLATIAFPSLRGKP
jgi:hypothetical protein